MDSRTDFQRLLEEMDRAIRRKQQELTELDERLETARLQLSEKEAKELLAQQQQESTIDETNASNDLIKQQDIDELVQEQRRYYERQMATLNEELAEYESTNRSLIKSNDQFRVDLELLRVSNDKLKDKIQILNENLDEVQNANFELNIRLAKAESESQMQHKLLKKSHEQDQILMNAFNNKLESMKAGIAFRDEEIRKLRLENQLTLESLGIELNHCDERGQFDNIDGRGKDSNEETDFKSTNDCNSIAGKQAMIRISQLIREKDAQIERLNDQLVQAIKELERNATLIETLTSERINNSPNTDKINAAGSRSNHDEESELALKNKMMEIELIEKDKQLHLIEKRNHHLESILPNEIIDLVEELRSRCKLISEIGCDDPKRLAGECDKIRGQIESLTENLDRLWVELDTSQRLLDKIDQLQRIIISRDEQIRHLVRELSEMDAKTNQDHHIFAPQLDDLKETRASSEGEVARENAPTGQDQDQEMVSDIEKQSINDGEHQAETTTDFKSAQQQTLHSEQKEEDSSGLLETTPPNAGETIEPPIPSLAVTDLDKNPSFENQAKTIGFSKNKQRVLITRHQLSRRRSIPTPTKRTIDWNNKRTKTTLLGNESNNIEQALNYRNRLRQLENENQLLELAMKEILLSIKWSDTKCSTILIDCPSLERLCQLIEARYIANGANRCRISSSQSQVGESNTLANALHDSNLSSKPKYMPSSECQNYSDGDIFQIVVLKSELDLLRGQNEQLRSDLKLYRSDWQHNMPSKDAQALVDQQYERVQSKGDHDGLRISETGCQTDSLILIDPRDSELNQQVLGTDRKRGNKCANCSRLVRLANHLLDCIVRIESRVNSSDESYISKLLTLYQLTQRLSRDLSLRDNVIGQLRREFYAISQQKMIVETRMHSLQGHVEIHNRICPLNYYVPTNKNHQEDRLTPNVQMNAATRNGNTETVHSLTIRSNKKQVEVPLRDSRITIALLQSIIGCLQARLDYKDERLNQLEQLIVGA